MAQPSSVVHLNRRASGAAARADGHLTRLTGPHLMPALPPAESALLRALLVPRRLGPLPARADAIDPTLVVAAAELTGLLLIVRDNALRAGLDRVAREASVAAQRQRFIGRERWNTAERAASAIFSATGIAPMALGALASTYMIHEGPEARLRDELVFLVPEPAAASVRLAVSALRGVRVSGRTLPGRARKACEDALWLRSTPRTDEGWHLPTMEDLALLTARDLSIATGPKRLGLMVDLHMALDDPHFHWETFIQRAGVWRVRDAAYRALKDLETDLKARVPQAVLRRLEPSVWEKVAGRLGR